MRKYKGDVSNLCRNPNNFFALNMPYRAAIAYKRREIVLDFRCFDSDLSEASQKSASLTD
ncbi:MAG: hypothetical protein CRN43_20780 [Candidatus Nephrothrix sp. EaCA]|nr:MAG: hypothetical protein CRN43_20780 [Candidatus Nephrothrix sp. EaCA]